MPVLTITPPILPAMPATEPHAASLQWLNPECSEHRRLQVMERDPALAEAVLCLTDTLGSSKILPKSIKTKTIERLPVGQHPWVGLSGGAEFMRCHCRVHIVEDLGLEDLYAGEHQLANRRLH